MIRKAGSSEMATLPSLFFMFSFAPRLTIRNARLASLQSFQVVFDPPY